MNGIHDMGGMQDMGPIQYEKNEPVFHAAWEGRVMAMIRAVGATGKLRGAGRPAIESLTAAEYLRMSYYERFMTALIEGMVFSGLVTRAEVASGKPAPGSAKAVPALNAADAAVLSFRVATGVNVAVAPKFQVGQRVRARNMHPLGHTRLPRYVRGRLGVIERDHGVQAFPDTNVYGRGQKPQHVYSVRFAARELWGEQASPRDAIYIEMWDDYLEPA
jgi:nitrile hydratase beta subunit